MSLVSEALKKAEREAAARDARDKGQPAPFEAPLQPYRSPRTRRALHPALAALAGGALIVALAAVWWAGARHVEARPALPEGPPRPAAAALPGATSASPAAELENRPAPPLPGAAAPPAAQFQTAQSPAEPVTREAVAALQPPAPLPRATAPPPGESSPAPARPQAAAAVPGATVATAPTAARSFGPGDYLLRADLPDGSRLELGGIVYSETSPFAFLNGRLVGVGEFVEGRRIDRIERDRVLLSGETGVLTLRLKAP